MIGWQAARERSVFGGWRGGCRLGSRMEQGEDQNLRVGQRNGNGRNE